ncbi:hypothetical protein E2C01_049635 [Portunus trituberculatus]|uniref:Uncharacterized protein n=1 Tax=Portunus trituberculatus TaxID=210409 RepID=A0A5B7G6X6_PORTR|nr:hypothetical protein [Portunus trituberculatus]
MREPQRAPKASRACLGRSVAALQRLSGEERRSYKRREGAEFPTASTPSKVSQGVGPRPQGLIWQEGDKPHTQPIRFRVQLACLDFRLQTPRTD